MKKKDPLEENQAHFRCFDHQRHLLLSSSMTSFVKYLLQPARAPKESFVSHFDDINIPDDLEIELGGAGSITPPTRLAPERSSSHSLCSKDIEFETTLLSLPHADDERKDEDEDEREERVVTSLRDIDINSPVVPASLSKTKESALQLKAMQPLRRSFAGFPSSAEKGRIEVVAEGENDPRRLFEEELETDQVIFSRVRHNRIEYVRSAFDAGMSALIVDDRGNSLLHVCAQNNLRKMAALVIRAGCPLNLRNKKGFTALDYCVKYSFFDMGDWLMTQGAYHGELFAVISDKPLRRNSIR